MKIVDEQGRLFGKINMVDLLVLLVLLGLIPSFYAGYKIITTKPVEEPVVVELPKKFIDLELSCKFIKIKPELLKLILVGDQEVDEKGQVIAEIIELGKSKPYKEKLYIVGKQKIFKEINNLKQVKANLRLKLGIKGDRLYYKNKELNFGSPLEFTFNKYSLLAILYKCLDRKEKVRIRVKFQELEPEICKLIKTGDEQIKITEGNKEVVSKIVKVVSNKLKAVAVLNKDRTEYKILARPLQRGIVLDIEILCLRNPEGIFLRGGSVKAGKKFTFSTSLYSISGVVIGMDLK